MDELDAIADALDRVLDLSGVKNIDPNRGGGGGITFLGYPTHGWESSDSQLEAMRMELLTRVRDWAKRFRLLFPNPTAQVKTRHDDAIELLENWLERGKKGRHSVPSTVAAAKAGRRLWQRCAMREISYLLTPLVSGLSWTPMP